MRADVCETIKNKMRFSLVTGLRPATDPRPTSFVLDAGMAKGMESLCQAYYESKMTDAYNTAVVNVAKANLQTADPRSSTYEIIKAKYDDPSLSGNVRGDIAAAMAKHARENSKLSDDELVLLRTAAVNRNEIARADAFNGQLPPVVTGRGRYQRVEAPTYSTTPSIWPPPSWPKVE